MSSPFLTAAVVTIVPAMGTLWWFLKRYEGYFEDARVFFSLMIGFFVGLVATGMQVLVFQFEFRGEAAEVGIGPGASLALTVTGYAFFQNGAKTIVLGLRRFRQRKDTPYYGAALGLGFGAMAALQFIAFNLQLAEDAGNPYRLLPAASMMAVPIGALFAHGATGVYVGKGSADGHLARGWMQAALLQMPVLAAYWVWVYFGNMGQGHAVVLFPGLLSLVYGVGLLLIAQRRVLDKIVPAEVAAQVRRARRRDARRAALGVPGPAGAGDVASAGAGDAASEGADDVVSLDEERMVDLDERRGGGDDGDDSEDADGGPRR